MLTLIIGPSMQWLSEEQTNALRNVNPEVKVVKAAFKEFPDGESYVRLSEESVDGGSVVILQSLSPPQDRSLMQLLQLVDASINLGAEIVAVFAPYLAYARQDKMFLKGEPVSVRVLLTSIFSAGARFLFTVDVHNPASLSLFPGKAFNLMPLHLLLKPLVEDKEGNDVIVVAPDKGAIERARIVAERFGLKYDYLDKRRDRITGEVVVDDRGVYVENKTVILVDDIISTGGTISQATRKLYSRGAKEVYIACSHALLVGDSLAKILSSGVKDIVSFNTLPPRPGVKYVDVLEWGLKQIYEVI